MFLFYIDVCHNEEQLHFVAKKLEENVAGIIEAGFVLTASFAGFVLTASFAGFVLAAGIV